MSPGQDDIKARPYELECGHKVWFKMAPDIDDIIYCRGCKDETRLLGSQVMQHGRYYHEDFWSERVGKKYNTFKGGCLKPDCFYEYTCTTGWFNLRDHMHKHYMREHTRFGATLEIKEVDYSSNVPPF